MSVGSPWTAKFGGCSSLMIKSGFFSLSYYMAIHMDINFHVDLMLTQLFFFKVYRFHVLQVAL